MKYKCSWCENVRCVDSDQEEIKAVCRKCVCLRKMYVTDDPVTPRPKLKKIKVIKKKRKYSRGNALWQSLI